MERQAVKRRRFGFPGGSPYGSNGRDGKYMQIESHTGE